MKSDRTSWGVLRIAYCVFRNPYAIRNTLLTLFLLVFFLAACNRDERPVELTIFAAASLTDAFNELADTFVAQNPDVTITLNFAGSTQLVAQLREGGTADLFASANQAQMDTAVAAGLIATNTTTTFASNQLTIIVPADNPAALTALEDLSRPGISLILAVPGVPVRQYTDEIMATLDPDFQAGFYNNLVSEEANVRQVAAKIALGEADAGIVYTSDVTPDLAHRVRQIVIPPAQNVVATYPIAPLLTAPQPDLAQRFITFTLSQEGQAILARWGFNPP
jgi:molybdate transport system substrate-binding protein